MSAEQVQAALIRLVRYPSLHRGEEVDAFVARFDLDAREASQVRALASSPHVAKFGFAERRARFHKSVRGPLPVAVRVIGEETAERLFAERFEPAHPVLGVAEIGGAFVAWLLAAFPALRVELGLPIWLPDVVTYEFAAFVTFGELLQRAWRVPEGSALRSDAPFSIVELAHDVEPWVEEASALDAPALPAAPPARRRTLMLLARVPGAQDDGDPVGCRCAIDDEVRAFLEAEREGRAHGARPRPAGVATLARIGVCK